MASAWMCFKNADFYKKIKKTKTQKRQKVISQSISMEFDVSTPAWRRIGDGRLYQTLGYLTSDRVGIEFSNMTYPKLDPKWNWWKSFGRAIISRKSSNFNGFWRPNIGLTSANRKCLDGENTRNASICCRFATRGEFLNTWNNQTSYRSEIPGMRDRRS